MDRNREGESVSFLFSRTRYLYRCQGHSVAQGGAVFVHGGEIYFGHIFSRCSRSKLGLGALRPIKFVI